MPRFRVTGSLTRTLRFAFVHEEVEADNEDDAIDVACELLDESDAFDIDESTHGLSVEELIPESDIPEDVRMRRMGAPMLPGIA